MDIAFTPIIIATIVQFVLGALWYGPLFGKQYMTIMGVQHMTDAEIKKMQQEMAPFYVLQLLLTLLATVALSCIITYMPQKGALASAFMVWLGFIVPTQISGVIWGNTKKAQWLKQILIMVSYSLISVLIAGYVISLWL